MLNIMVSKSKTVSKKVVSKKTIFNKSNLLKSAGILGVILGTGFLIKQSFMLEKPAAINKLIALYITSFGDKQDKNFYDFKTAINKKSKTELNKLIDQFIKSKKAINKDLN
jgi:hypothetical protein